MPDQNWSTAHPHPFMPAVLSCSGSKCLLLGSAIFSNICEQLGNEEPPCGLLGEVPFTIAINAFITIAINAFDPKRIRIRNSKLPAQHFFCKEEVICEQQLMIKAGHDADAHAGLQEHKAELQASDPQLQLAPLEDVFLTVVRKAELENSQERGQIMRLVVSEEHLVLKVRQARRLCVENTSAHVFMTHGQ